MTEEKAPERAMAAVTAEDLAFERELQAMEQDTPEIDPVPANTTVRVKKEMHNLLSDVMAGIHPAATVNELLALVHMAKEVGADSIEATPELIKQYTLRSGFPSDVGYFWFQDVKVWIPGFLQTHGHLDGETIDKRVFGVRPGDITPIMNFNKG